MNATRFVDATLRDLAAPPWGATLDTEELVAAASALAGSGAVALEALDPPSARATIEARSESPWDRLRAVVRVAGSTPVGIVIAGKTLWGDRPVAPGVVRQFVLCAYDSGARRIRAFDPMNAAETLRPAADAAQDAGAAFVPTLTLGPAPAAADPLWISEAKALATLPGVSTICIADGGGFLAPQELATLVAAVVDATGCAVELALQAPAGIAPLSAVAGVDAGVSAVHASAGLVALAASRPAISTMHAALTAGHVPLSANMDRVDIAARLVGAMLPADRMRHAAAALSAPALSLPPELVAGLIARLIRLGVLDRVRQTGEEVVGIAQDLGAVTLAGPIGAAIVAQAARHAMDGDRWGDMDPVLANVALGHLGPLRGRVSPDALQAAEGVRLGGISEIGIEEMHRDGPSGASEEDLVLWAQFPDAAERLHRRRRSLTDDLDEPTSTPGLDRLLLETLVDVVEGSDEAEVQVEVGGARVTVRRAGPAMAPAPGGGAAAPDSSEGMVRVESPMVGTFYRSSSPEAGPFCTVGDRVEAGQTLCLVEAMKLFNEISCAVGGVVKEICVENEEPVEYGQMLFVIEPA